MPKLTREFGHYTSGSHGEREEWWHLILDTDTSRLYVERKHDNVNPYGGGGSQGKKAYSLEEFFEGQWRGNPKETLLELMATMFPEAKDA